jgi:ribosomal protein S12 methylthiotransferase accessory factor
MLGTTSLDKASRLRRARVLVVGLEPWGAVAAADLAAAGIGALHLLDDRRVGDDDLAAVRLLVPADLGAERAPAVARALGRAARGGEACAVSTGALLAAAGRPLTLGDTRWDLVLACVPADDLFVLQSVARFAHAASLISLSAHLDGLSAVIGPAVVPGRTACWNCARVRRLAAAKRRRRDDPVHAALLAERPPARARTYLGPMPGALGHALALAALDVLGSPDDARVTGQILVENLVTLESTLHRVLRLPECDVCGGARSAEPCPHPPVDLATARDPAELHRMLAGIVDARTGIITSLVMASQDSPHGVEMPITATAALAAYGGCALHDDAGTGEDGSGKGLTHVQAMIRASGEAIERYAAARIDPRAIVRAPAAALQGDVLDPSRLCLYGEGQYAERDFPFARLAPEATIDWTLGAWLDSREPVYLPALPTYSSYPVRAEEYFCQVTSNGLAAGPTFDQAAMGAALELIERDAFTLSWLARLPARRILLDDSVGAPVRDVARQLAAASGDLRLYLLDAGVHVPVVMCVLFGDGARWPGATVSIAAHLGPRAAIEKAILEQGQGGPYYRRLLEEGKSVIPARPEEVRTLEDHALYYFPKQSAAAFAFLDAGGSVPAAALDEPADLSLGALVSRLRASGMRVAVADLTSPDLAATPFRVARALGPDFQQIHFGHRLARLGNPRLARLLHGSVINPDPHPLD